MAATSASVAATSVPPSSDSGNCLLVGATGAVGRQVLASLLNSSEHASVYELGRRATEYPVKGVNTPSQAQLSKLRSLTVNNDDFEDPARLKSKLPTSSDWSSVYITLGTTRASAGGAEAFQKIDRHYVLNAAQAARLPERSQRLVYCSSTGANANSSFLYMRSKGMTEQGLASLGYDETIIFRPGFLRVADGRDVERKAESIYGMFTKHVMSRFSSNAEIETPVLAAAMTNVGRMGVQACLDAGIGENLPAGKEGQAALIISNGDAIKLAGLQL